MLGLFRYGLFGFGVRAAADDVREALVSLLSADPGVAALVGDRIFPERLPQGQALPAITYAVIDDRERVNLSGPRGHTTTRVQVDALAATGKLATATDKAVRDALHGFAGTVGTVVFTSCLRKSQNDAADADGDGTGGRLARVSADYTLRYRVAIPTP